jgi:hypothetical protein
MFRSLLIILTLSTFSAFGQKPRKAIKKLGSDPVFFVDSANIDKSDLHNYQPTDIATVSIYHDSDAIRLVGPDGKDGAVYIETKTFARKRYWQFFSSKSPEYAKIVPEAGSDTAIQYILNKRILTTNFEGDLAIINDSIFKRITILDKEALQDQYHITDKTYGVLIESAKPASLYHAKRKF